MELKAITMENLDNDKYERAKKRVKEIKGFYSHLTAYLIVNAMLILLRFNVFENGFVNIEIPSWSFLTTPFFWGIGLFFHGIYVFQDKFSFLKDWEERKIQEYMDKEEGEFKETDKWD